MKGKRLYRLIHLDIICQDYTKKQLLYYPIVRPISVEVYGNLKNPSLLNFVMIFNHLTVVIVEISQLTAEKIIL